MNQSGVATLDRSARCGLEDGRRNPGINQIQHQTSHSEVFCVDCSHLSDVLVTHTQNPFSLSSVVVVVVVVQTTIIMFM